MTQKGIAAGKVLATRRALERLALAVRQVVTVAVVLADKANVAVCQRRSLKNTSALLTTQGPGCNGTRGSQRAS